MGVNPNFGHLPYQGQGFDYSPKVMKKWVQAGNRVQTSLVQKKPEVGLIAKTGKDMNYFGDFGNAKHSTIQDPSRPYPQQIVPLNKVGEYFSRAYTTQVRVGRHQQYGFHPSIGADLGNLHRKLKAYAAKKGLKDSFQITEFGAGMIGEGIAGVLPTGNGNYMFAMHPKFSQKIKALAQAYGVSTKAARIYAKLHEDVHLLGKGPTPSDEKSLEALLKEFSAKELKNMKSAKTHSNYRRLELEGILRDIHKIASHREKITYNLYLQRGPQNVGKLVQQYAREAARKGYSEKGIQAYVMRKLKEGKRKKSKRKKPGKNKSSRRRSAAKKKAAKK